MYSLNIAVMFFEVGGLDEIIIHNSNTFAKNR